MALACPRLLVRRLDIQRLPRKSMLSLLPPLEREFVTGCGFSYTIEHSRYSLISERIKL